MSDWMKVLPQNKTVHICPDWQRPLGIKRMMHLRATFIFGSRRLSGHWFPCKAVNEWCLLLACIRHLMLMTGPPALVRPSSCHFVSRRFISTLICLSHIVSFPLCHTSHRYSYSMYSIHRRVAKFYMHIYICSRQYRSIGIQFLGQFLLTSVPHTVEYPQFLLIFVIFFPKHHRKFGLALTPSFVIRLVKKRIMTSEGC